MMSCEAKCKYWKPVLNFISYYLVFHLHANKHLYLNTDLLFIRQILSGTLFRMLYCYATITITRCCCCCCVCYCCKKLSGGMETCTFESMCPVRLHTEKQLSSRGLDLARCSACNVRSCHGSPQHLPRLLIHITAASIGILISALFTIIILCYSKKKKKGSRAERDWGDIDRYVLLLTVGNFMWLLPPV